MGGIGDFQVMRHRGIGHCLLRCADLQASRNCNLCKPIADVGLFGETPVCFLVGPTTKLSEGSKPPFGLSRSNVAYRSCETSFNFRGKDYLLSRHTHRTISREIPARIESS